MTENNLLLRLIIVYKKDEQVSLAFYLIMFMVMNV